MSPRNDCGLGRTSSAAQSCGCGAAVPRRVVYRDYFTMAGAGCEPRLTSEGCTRRQALPCRSNQIAAAIRYIAPPFIVCAFVDCHSLSLTNTNRPLTRARDFKLQALPRFLEALSIESRIGLMKPAIINPLRILGRDPAVSRRPAVVAPTCGSKY